MKEKVGVIIGRFQVADLHEGHIGLFEHAFSKHSKIIVFLGVSSVSFSKRNPLDFLSRKGMLEDAFYDKINMIYPLRDNRDDYKWSKDIDNKIEDFIGSGKAILYGSRDSFISHYHGKFETKEVPQSSNDSGSQRRDEVSKTVISSNVFRAGIIYAACNMYPIMYSTVDVAILDDKGNILLGRKPDEKEFRFIGGFVDVSDVNDYATCRREAFEETNASVEPYEYVGSFRVDDWRFAKETDRKIMTRLYKARFISGMIKASDDIAEIKWFSIKDIDWINQIVLEHRGLFGELLHTLK